MTPVSSPSPCTDCGSDQRFGTCHDLFLVLLAHDYEGQQPYASWHALNVAGYLLQHPSGAQQRVLAGQLEVVRRFAQEGLDGVRAVIDGAVRRNNHRIRSRPWGEASLPVARRRPETTIETVSVDGTFPADGYSERMRAWILDTVRCYS